MEHLVGGIARRKRTSPASARRGAMNGSRLSSGRSPTATLRTSRSSARICISRQMFNGSSTLCSTKTGTRPANQA
jgi:hypothetical protein